MKKKTPEEIAALQDTMRTSILACHKSAAEIAGLIGRSKDSDDSEAALIGLIAGSVLVSKGLLDGMLPETASKIVLIAQIVEASKEMNLTPEQSAERCAAAVPECVEEIEAEAGNYPRPSAEDEEARAHHADMEGERRAWQEEQEAEAEPTKPSLKLIH